MNQREVDALLRIKQAREQRASAEASRMRLALARSQTAGEAAHAASNNFAERRRVQEGQIYAALTAERLPVVKLQEAASRLTGIAAYAAVLRQQIVRAEAECAAATERARAADRVQQAAIRKRTAADAVRDDFGSLYSRAEEQGREAELEEICERRPSGNDRESARRSGW